MSASTIVYLSSQFSYPGYEKVLDWYKRSGCKQQCFSFAFITPTGFFYSKVLEEQYRIALKQGIKIMIDSSAHSFQKFVRKASSGSFKSKFSSYGQKPEELRDQTIKLFTEFCKRDSAKWDFYVNFDYVRVPEVIFAMQQTLEKKGLKPIPVYHGEYSLDWLKKYIDLGYKYIGVGGPSYGGWKNLGQVFEIAEKHGVGIHGFARTSPLDIIRWPWKSVDSATWIKASCFGKIIIPIPGQNTAAQIHISNRKFSSKGSANYMQPSVKKSLRDIVEKQGFDFELMQDNLHERTVFNAYVLSNFSKFNFKTATSNWGRLI